LNIIFREVPKLEAVVFVAGGFDSETIRKREVKVKGIVERADLTCGVSWHDMFTSIEEQLESWFCFLTGSQPMESPPAILMKQALKEGVSVEVDSKRLLEDSLNVNWASFIDNISRHIATLNCKSGAVL
jgi:hypothetical protein